VVRRGGANRHKRCEEKGEFFLWRRAARARGSYKVSTGGAYFYCGSICQTPNEGPKFLWGDRDRIAPQACRRGKAHAGRGKARKKTSRSAESSMAQDIVAEERQVTNRMYRRRSIALAIMKPAPSIVNMGIPGQNRAHQFERCEADGHEAMAGGQRSRAQRRHAEAAKGGTQRRPPTPERGPNLNRRTEPDAL
jgi:hypothetical protein